MIINMSGGGSPGKIVTVHVTYGGAAGSGANVVCTNGKKTFYGITDSEGNAVFKLTKGGWTITADKNGSTSSLNVDVSGDCTVDISLFAATINVTYPAGCTCTATDGVTTLTAPDTSGTWALVVQNAGTWTVSLNSGFKETVNVTVSGNTYTLNKWHIFNGASDCTAVSGGWTAEAKKTSSDTQAYAARPGITQGSNYIKFSIGANQCGMVYTTKKVSLKGIKTIKVSGTLANAGGFDHSLTMTVWSSIGTYCDDNNAAEAGTTPGTTANSLSLNVSSLSGSYYIGFKFNTRNASASYASITEFSLIC